MDGYSIVVLCVYGCIGWDWVWTSLGGMRYRAPYGADNQIQMPDVDHLCCQLEYFLVNGVVDDEPSVKGAKLAPITRL